MGKDLKGRTLEKGIYQRPDRKYVARYTSISGKRIEKHFEKLPEAKLWLRDSKYLDSHSTISYSTSLTADAWFNYWLDNILKERIKLNTRTSYKGRYNNRISPVIGNMLLNDIKPMNCQAVLNECMEHEDSSGSIAKVRSIMKMMFDSAIENHMMDVNPVTSNVKYKSTKPKERRVLTKEEQNTFRNLCEHSTYKNVFLFILNTGMRIGEVQSLRWGAIDFTKKTVNVMTTGFYSFEKKNMVTNDPKSEAGKRCIPMTKEACKILTELKKNNNSTKKDDYVFVNSVNNPLRHTEVNKALQRIIKKKMGIDNFSTHNLRHTFATRCIENGMKPKVLQMILGHENITTTMNLYVHVTDEEMATEMAKAFNFEV